MRYLNDMITVVLASKNKKKIKELQIFLKELISEDIEVLSLEDIGFEGDIEENGNSFEENSIIKASVPAKYGYIGIADDSGLCVEALNGAPGIYSARFSGGSDEDNNDLLLSKLKGVSNRNAKYVCAMSCVFPDHKNDFTVVGECHGIITQKRMGNGGFGYDPLFYYEDFKKTFAQVSLEEKNKVSHRAVAMKKFAEKFEKVIKNDK